MIKTLKFVSCYVLLLIFSNLYAQDQAIDSLQRTFNNPSVHDTTKLRTIALFRDQNYTAQDSSYFYLCRLIGEIASKNYKNKKSNSLETQKKYTMWLGSYYSSLGAEYFQKPDKKNGLPYFDKSIAYHKEAEEYRYQHFAMISKAALLIEIKEYDKAIPYIFKAIKYFEINEDEVGAEDLAYAYTALGYVYAQQGKHEEAIKNYKKVLELFKEYDRDNYVDYQMGQTHSRMANSYMKLKDYPQVIDHSETSLELTKPMNDKYLNVLNLCRIGMVKLEESEFNEAEVFIDKALDLRAPEEVNETAFMSAYLAKARLYFQKNELSKAAEYAEKSLAISKSSNDLSYMTDSSALLYKISLADDNYKRALEMYQLEQKVGDSSKMEAAKNALAQQLLQYDFEKKELNLKLDAEKKAATKNNWLIGLSGLVLVMVLGLYFYYRNNKQKQSIAVLEKDRIKQKLLITQMNPHFIFNSIDNIQGLIHAKKEDDAINYLTKFSKLTRQILENSNENYISLAEEVEMTENYLAIQQLLYSNKFSYHMNVEASINTEAIFLPPMLTQPFIENAIKHGLGHTNRNGMIDINFYLKEDKLFFKVLDNGNGFDMSKTSGNHKSLAMTITKERLVNYTKNQDFVVEADNVTNEDGKIVGAKVVFEIPYIYEN
ncbi:histidine kinase [Mesoflavibacter zeaxanthinifaciens]|uniref:tetratricopeptide repeat-containing sensor histidine kinase n=1 Tax=Mesoflavibacter zeaxanthinifaciens TaxID=393060 RepID=UPI003A945BB2